MWGISWVPWGVQYRGGYHEYRGGLSWAPWGMFSTMEGYHDARGGYHEYHGGCSVLWGTQITKDFSPMVLNTLHSTHDIPHVHHESPTVLNIPHSTQDNTHGTHDILCGTQDIPHIYHDIPSRYEHPHGTQDIPHGTRDIPPRYSWYPPTVLNTPTVLSTPTVLHTHYTGCLCQRGAASPEWKWSPQAQSFSKIFFVRSALLMAASQSRRLSSERASVLSPWFFITFGILQKEICGHFSCRLSIQPSNKTIAFYTISKLSSIVQRQR